jgi:hypothetical protein
LGWLGTRYSILFSHNLPIWGIDPAEEYRIKFDKAFAGAVHRRGVWV